MHTIKLKGKVTGDCECWCFEVSEAVYKAHVCDNDYELEKRERAEEGLGDIPWMLYPNDLINAYVKNRDNEIELTITINELEK